MSYVQSTLQIIGFLLISVYVIIKSIVKAFIPMKYKMKSVAGEVVLVTGGGNGIGRLLALRFADLGSIVVVWDINKHGIDETIKLVQSAGGTCYGYICNVCDREDVYTKAELVQKEVGKVTILINNAGVVTGMKFLDTPDTLIVRTMDVNIMSHFWTAKAFLPAMMEDNRGHICSIASMAGHVGIPKLVDYCASKYAAVGFDEALRMELEADGYDIHTTVVCPYFIRSTGMFNAVQSRYIATLSANEVAEIIVTAIRLNDKYAIIPSFMRPLLAAKWIFPWPCIAMFLRGIVADVAHPDEAPKNSKNENEEISDVLLKDESGGPVHQQLTRRVSSSERKP